MKKTAYFTDQDFRNYLLRSERKLKNQFYAMLACSIICLCCIGLVFLTDPKLNTADRWFMLIIGILTLNCLGGLGYCYRSVQRERLNYEELLRRQQKEMNTLIDEIQAERTTE